MKKLSYVLAILIAAASFIPSLASTAISKSADAPNQDKTATSSVRQFSGALGLLDGTTASITIIANSSEESKAVDAMSIALTHVRALDNEIFSPGGVDEKIASLKTGERLELPSDAFDMISKAVELSALTNGWYDVTAPSERHIFRTRDWRRVTLDKNTHTIAFTLGGMHLDLRRIFLGFAADLIMQDILQAGFSDAKVSVGPVQRVAGNDIFSRWGMQISFGGAGEYSSRALNYKMTNVASATITDDGLGSNLIDAKSKQPVPKKLTERVTVMASDAMTATAYVIAAYTLGPKIGLRFIEAHPETQGIIVDIGGNLFASKGFKTTNAITRETAEEIEALSTPDGGSNDLKQKEREEEKDE